MILACDFVRGTAMLRLAVVGIMCAGTSSAQQGQALPDEMRAHFPSNVLATIMYPIGSGQHVEDVFGGISFDTTDRKIRIDWIHGQDGVESGVLHVEYPLSYEPTAICTRTGAGPVLYVAGYIQRTGHVVVEEWTFTNILLGQAVPVGGGTPKSTLSMNLTKSIVLLDSAVMPIRAICYVKPQARLWLIEEAAPNVVWSVETETGNRSFLFDASIVPELPLFHSARTALVKPQAPDGGGFVVQFYKARPWKPTLATPFTSKPTDQLYILRDQNLDGVMDEATVIQMGDIEDVRQYVSNDDTFYP